jgi:amidase
VFVLTGHPTASVDSEIVAAIDDLAAQLEKAGASVSRHSELLPSLAESQALVERFTEVARSRMPSLGGPPPNATVKDYVDCITAQEVIRRQWDAFFQSFDVVIAPCYATPAFPHISEPDPWPGLNRTLRIDGAEVAYAPQHAWPLMAGMPQLPATAAPIGRTRGGLPIGAQFIGPFLEDLTTIAFAGHVSAEFGLTAEIAPAKR